ncbi:hypothetical protein [Actinomadura montaniterrae]|uniref:Uncharacterized protein n=1 Tax=Actinomadura montaniterrae TaxID=1803903 RepID=A0A6L3VXZ7_9ACTN|nr:hypothetical protein [Actinomadura montaniterrae]KAB2384760.1 hypothetical protein F9B16_09945 [Actinomadura montaniterrae]
MADNTTVERFVADVENFVQNTERAARSADRLGEQSREARERVEEMGRKAAEAAERAARAQAAAAEEAEKLARGEGNAERAAQAAARAQRELERAQVAQARAARAAARATDEEADQYRQLAREAAAAGIAERLAALRASGQLKEHNELVRRLRDEYGNLGRDSDHAFREMESRGRRAFDGLSGMVGGVDMKIQAAIAILPFVAAAAAGAITLAFGGALSAVAIMAAAKSKQVQSSFSGLKDHVVHDLEEWAKPWEPTLQRIARAVQSTFDAFGPTLKTVFADLAPVVEQFVGQLLNGLREFEPTIKKFADAFQAVLGELGPKMDTILRNISDGLNAVADAAKDNPQAFADLIEDFSTLINISGQLIGLLTRLEKLNEYFPSGLHMISMATDLWHQANDGAAGSLNDVHNAVQAASNAYERAAAATQVANDAQTSSSRFMDLASKSAKDLKAALDNLTGKELSSREAAAQYGSAVLALNKSLKENGSAHGFATAKGIANEQALDSLAQAAQQNAVAMRDNGASAADVAKFMASARARIIKAAESMHYSHDEAVKLADKLLGVKGAVNAIPKQHNTKVTANTSQARADVQYLIEWIRAQTASIIVHTIGGRAMGGPVQGLAAGGAPRQQPGKVRGRGTDTSDSNLVRLSNNEFVMNAAATRKWEPVLAWMNRAAGAGSTTLSAPAQYATINNGGTKAVTNVTVNVTVQGSVTSERNLAKAVQSQLLSGRLAVALPAGR